MENSNSNNNTDAIILEVEGIDQELDDHNTQINEMRDSVSKLQEEYTERYIKDAQAEEEQNETVNEYLEDVNTNLLSIDAKLDLNNHLFASQFFMIGVFLGVVLFRILYDRLRV